MYLNKFMLRNENFYILLKYYYSISSTRILDLRAHPSSGYTF